MADEQGSSSTPEPRIVAGIGTAVGMHDQQNGFTAALAAAQVTAIEQAIADGVSVEDTVEMLKRKAAAHDKVMADYGQL